MGPGLGITIMRQQTWFAAIVCTIAVLPGFIVGALFKAFLYIFGGWAEGSDFLYLRILFGIETPGKIYEWVFAQAIPNFMQAVIAGFVAVWLMEKIAKGAHHSLAATIAGALYTGFLICLLVIVLPKLGVTSEMLVSTVQCVGLWIGLGSAAAALPAPRSAAAV
jgi:hypothetical protein